MILIYQHSSVTIFNWTPPSIAGTVGAILNSSLQLGSALGTTIVTTIEQEVEAKQTRIDYHSKYAGCSAAFIFYAALLVFAAIMTAVFYKPKSKPITDDENVNVIELLPNTQEVYIAK